MAQLVVQPNPHLINADNSSDDVQEIGCTPTKNSKTTYYNQRPNELTKAHVTELDAISQDQKASLSRGGTESQKKMNNSLIMTPDTANRKHKSVKTFSNHPSDDKNFKSNDIGGANQLIFLLLPNQSQLALGNPYNFSSLLPAHNLAMFSQNFGSYPQLINPDGHSLLYNGNNGMYFPNGAVGLNQMDPRSLMQSAPLNSTSIKDQRKQLGQNIQSMLANQAVKNSNPQAHPPTAENTLAHDLQGKRNVPEESMDIEKTANYKNAQGEAVEGFTVKKKKVRQCFNIYCQTDPENAALWSKTRITGKMSCKTCEEAWKKHQYCYFCKQVYLEEGEAFNDPKPWIGCDSCERWTHTECEDKTIQKRIKWHQDRNEDFEYKCPTCRSKAKNGGRPKSRRGSLAQSNDMPVVSMEFLLHEEFQEDSARKQVKMNPESPENKCVEFNTNSNSNLITANEEHCHAKKKLENMFNKHMQKRKMQPAKPTVQIDFFTAIDALLNQYGKKLQLTENEIQTDIMMMRDACKTDAAEYGNMSEEETDLRQNNESPKSRKNSRTYLEEPGIRAQSRARGGTRACGSRKNNNDITDDISFTKDDLDTEYIPGSQATRRNTARTKRTSD